MFKDIIRKEVEPEDNSDDSLLLEFEGSTG